MITAFSYGLISGHKKIFPFEQIRYFKEITLGKTDSRDDFVSNKEFSPYYYEKTSQFDLLYKSEKTYNFVMIGDSITDHGEWNELTKRDDIINRGIGGDNTYGVLKRLDNLNPALKKAFIMIGVNDVPILKVNVAYDNYIKIIDLLIEKNIEPIIQSTLYMSHSVGGGRIKVGTIQI